MATNDVRKKALALKKEYTELSKEFMSEAKNQDKILFVGFDLLKALAKQSSEDEWLAFYTTGEIPAVKLSKEQMQALKGGKGFFNDFYSSFKSTMVSTGSLAVGVGRAYVGQQVQQAQVGWALGTKALDRVGAGLSWAVNAGADAMCDAADENEERIWGEKDPWGLGKK